MVKEIPLSRGKFALVDDADYEWLNQWKWTYLPPSYKGSTGYAYRNDYSGPKPRNVIMHRLIVDASKGKVVDHINHNGLDNRRSNLRLASECENHYNARPRTDGVSKYKGVYYDARCKKWAAEIRADNKKHFLGYFHTELEAATAYNTAATEKHGAFALINDLAGHQETDVLITPKKTRKSQYRGVYFAKDKQKWRAEIYIDGKRKILGTFATELDAALAYKNAST